MAKKTASTPSQKRKPRLLWANFYCLMDTSSGASMSVSQMLRQLVKQGYDIKILGATIFDNPKGASKLQHLAPDIATKRHNVVSIVDGELIHELLITQNTYRNNLTEHEESLWLNQYRYLLDSFKPDVVWFYGGQTSELLIPDEARARGVPSAFYLANGNYISSRWCRDVDLVLTDSESTSVMYREKVGFTATPVGKFIDPKQFVAEDHQRNRVLFINPSWEKGASIFVQLALKLEKECPDITLEVVEARADWSAVLKETTQLLGEPRDHLTNVVVTKNTTDMRPVYERARVLLAPSLWWESGARVLAEAMLNGIPAIVSNHGGSAGLIGEGGIVLDFPDDCHEKPYKYMLSEEELKPLCDGVVNLFYDQELYSQYVEKAYQVGKEKHHIDISTQRLVQALTPLVTQKAGNKDFIHSQRKLHKHKLAGQVKDPGLTATLGVATTPPTGNAEPESVVSEISSQPEEEIAYASAPHVRDDFSWELKERILVLDNRAKLIQTGAVDEMVKTNAFSVLAFDPASEIKNPKVYEGHEHIQVFQHALLGDGQPTKLNACLEADLTSTLRPLPEESLPEHQRKGAKVLAQLPINTVALDSIDGLPSLDWLILDDRSDTITVLEHGKHVLQETLLIQARVAFHPTHEQQPSFAELQHWASHSGFRFYRFNDMAHRSMFDTVKRASQNQSSELQSADALFLPTPERLEAMTEIQQRKLAFILHVAFGAHDAAYRTIQNISKGLSETYYRFIYRSEFDEGEEKLSEKNDKKINSKLMGRPNILVSGKKVF